MILLVAALAPASKPESDYPVKEVPLTSVKFTDTFWAPRQRTDISVTIPHEMKQCELTGRIRNFETAGGEARGKFATRYAFDDSDVYKVIEAAAYTLMLRPNSELEKAVDSWVAKIAKAQEPDGYLYTARTIDPANPPGMSGPERWSRLKDSHELYNVGHLYEAATAYYQATGKRALLDVAVKSADFIAETFGPGQSQLKLVPGHEEIEIGLVKLYRVTGKSKHLDLAKFFIDERGNAAGHKLYGEYSQDHKLVVEQSEAVGHAVRAAYFYSGATDVAALTGDGRYMPAMESIWSDIVSRKLYLTGGIGAAGRIEGFGPAYDLPNATGYAETCATIAYALWNYRMFRYYGDGKYMDLFERAAYNAFLSGAGMSGDLYFYPNPLASFGQHQRSPWFPCSCCPPNVARFIAAMGGFAYGVAGDRIYVNLYAQGTSEIETRAGKVAISQTTEYPWKGDVQIRVIPERPANLTLMVRIPGWAQGRPFPSDLYMYAGETRDRPVVRVNDEIVTSNPERGYIPVTRTWQKGDRVEVSLPMAVRRVLANRNIAADEGRVAVERGPFVYCAEWTDNNGYASNLVLDDAAVLAAGARPGLLNGIMVITGDATAYCYRNGKVTGEKQRLTLIPYYAWAHRGKGEMVVWLAREKGKARIVPEPTLASNAKGSASTGATDLEFVHDLLDQEGSGDTSSGHLYWPPKKGAAEWVQYDFEKPITISETAVYWFADTGEGECRVPVSWKAFYRSGESWVPVKTEGPFGVAKDTFNTVQFAPVKTTALRLLIQMPDNFSSGILEWKVK